MVTFRGKEVVYCRSAWPGLYWVTPSIHGNRFVCVLPMQPRAQSTVNSYSPYGGIVWEKVCSEGSVFLRRAQEVTDTGVEWWIREVTAVLTQTHIHVVLDLPTNRLWLLLWTKHITHSFYFIHAWAVKLSWKPYCRYRCIARLATSAYNGHLWVYI